MKFILAIASLLVASCMAEADLTGRWAEYKADHGKIYESAEIDNYRFQLWKTTVQRIEEHNKRYEAGEVSYYLGLNQMSDMTSEEKKMFRGKGLKAGQQLDGTRSLYRSQRVSRPDSVDWRQKNAVNGIKNQGQCGSCWAFSTIASVEGQYAIKNSNLLSFSEQQLVDCVKTSDGCEGGLMDFAFTYLETHGLENETAYPYHAQDQTCSYTPSEAILAKITGFTDLPSGDENALQDAIASVGPISIAIDASGEDFQDYAGGVYDSQECGNGRSDLDHGVAVVGYGKDAKGGDYYIVRNSWGTGWGANGYIWMSRNKNNQCGIATMASYPKL